MGSAANLIATLAGGASIGGLAAPPPVVAASAALDLLMVIVGFAVRRGLWWIPAINVTAVVVFLYGTAALDSGLSEVPLVFALLYAVVFVTIFLNRPWFDASAAWRARRG